MSSITVADAMVRDVVTFPEGVTVNDAEMRIRSDPFYRHRGFPVLNEEGKLAGMVTTKDIVEALSEGKMDMPIREIITKDISTCFPNDNLKTALQKLGEKNVGRIPVVEREDPQRLAGLITRENIIVAYHEASLRKKEQ